MTPSDTSNGADKTGSGEWVLVPREPTEAMIEAVSVEFGMPGEHSTVGLRAYRAMIAAAPSPQTDDARSRDADKPSDPPLMDREAEPWPSDELVAEVMNDTWCEICSDANAHPDDIHQVGRRHLEYRPRHWTSYIAAQLRHEFAALRPPLVGEDTVVEDDDIAGAAERDVGRYIYNRIEALMDATEGPRAAELTYLAEVVGHVEEYGEPNCSDSGVDAWPERLS